MSPEFVNRNIFQKEKLYVSPVLTDEQKAQVLYVLNLIADNIQAQLSDEEFIQELSNKTAVIQYVVGHVNANTDESIRVDGYNIAQLVDIVIDERITAIKNKSQNIE